ncbi:MAG: DsbA family protein [Actinomycetota bacterium]
MVEIFSDVVCPWFYIGKKRFDSAVSNLLDRGTALDLDVRFRPFQAAEILARLTERAG